MNAAAAPFSVRLNAGILELTLDTPGCSHNIFSTHAAIQLCEILRDCDPHNIAVVLIRSGKRASWVNGVGLLMAGTAKHPDDIPAMTESVTRAYRALREFPAPSIAVIDGNCYGCGVEFALHCDYRLACNQYETHFYMTELADYLFIPAFGATQDLPRLLGLRAATDLLLWGERWSAQQATERGLIDEYFEVQEFGLQVAKFAQELATAPRKRPIALRETWGPSLDTHTITTSERIDSLPPSMQPVYQRAYSLMLSASRAHSLSPRDYAGELRACSESVIRPIAKAAVAFFFIRQLATHYCLRGYDLPATIQLAIDPEDSSLSNLRKELAHRRVRGLQLVSGGHSNHAPRNCDASPEGTRIEFISVPPEGPSLEQGVIGVIGQPLRRPPVEAAIVYCPFVEGGSRLVEIEVDRLAMPLGRAVFALFDRAGYCATLSHPHGEFATNVLLVQHLAPLIAYVMHGGAAADVHATLREFGVVRRLTQPLMSMPPDLLCRWITPLVAGDPHAIGESATELFGASYHRGCVRESVRDAWLVSLSVFAINSVRNGHVPHPAMVDVMARELIDFPLMSGSLCRYLCAAELLRLLRREGAWSSYFSRDFASHARQVLATRHRFYSGTRMPAAHKHEEAHA